jgi:hypothetical protein
MNELYPDPEERSRKIFKEQQKASTWGTVKLIITTLVILVIILATGYWLYSSGVFNKAKKRVAGQINDGLVKNDVSRAKTVSGFYYNSYKTYKGMGNDPDFQNIIQESASHGSELHLEGLGEKTFVAWVILPESQKYYCLDASGFTGEVGSINATQTTCK